MVRCISKLPSHHGKLQADVTDSRAPSLFPGLGPVVCVVEEEPKKHGVP